MLLLPLTIRASDRSAAARNISLGMVLGVVVGLLAIGSLPTSAADSTTSSDSGAAAASDAALSDRDGDWLLDDFEKQWGVSDPDDPDSDGDGLRDSAEDDDGDRVSALGEQRFGTDPSNADSDGDGVPDGDDDSDGDGLADALQQDQRAVPDPLVPTPEEAWWDRPVSYDEGCHGGIFDPELYPCVFGDVGSDRTVAIFGDSHALQWLPALIGAGKEDGWQVVTLTKSACPSADVVFQRAAQYDGADPSCSTWRSRALEWIAENEPQLVMLSSAGRQYKLVDAKGALVPDESRTQHWQDGLARVLQAIPTTTTAVVLADTPQLKANPASCLPEHPRDISACVTARDVAAGTELDDAERTTAEHEGAIFDSLNDKVCSYDPCPVVIEEVMMWRNNAHITATFAALLAPSMGDVLERAYQQHLARPSGGQGDEG